MVDGFPELIEKRCLPNALMRVESQEGNSPGFQPKSMTCFRNVAFLREPPKTTFQEGNDTTSCLKNHAQKSAPFSPYSLQSAKQFLPRSHLQTKLMLGAIVNCR
jgi:hypothetical protein